MPVTSRAAAAPSSGTCSGVSRVDVGEQRAEGAVGSSGLAPLDRIGLDREAGECEQAHSALADRACPAATL